MLTFAQCVCLLREQTDLACASLIPAHTRAPSIIAGPQATVPPPAGDAPPLPTRLADDTAEQPRDTPLSLRAQQCWLIDAHSSQASIYHHRPLSRLRSRTPRDRLGPQSTSMSVCPSLQR